MLDCEQFLKWPMVPNKTIYWHDYKLLFGVRGGRGAMQGDATPSQATPPFHLFNYHGLCVPPNLISFLNDK